jgi:hypothetical protein
MHRDKEKGGGLPGVQGPDGAPACVASGVTAGPQYVGQTSEASRAATGCSAPVAEDLPLQRSTLSFQEHSLTAGRSYLAE